MAKKKKYANGTSTAKGKRKSQEAVDVETSKGKKKRPKTGHEQQVVTPPKPDKFYYYESSDPKESCNLLLQKRLVHSSTALQRNEIAPFEYISGTDFSKTRFKNCNDRINSNDSNLLVGGMSPKEVQMWSSYVGANYAAKGFPPANIARKLGRITRRIWLPSQHTKENQILKNSHYHPLHRTMTETMMLNDPNGKPGQPSWKKLAKELRNSQDGQLEAGETEDDRMDHLESTAKSLVRAWGLSAKRNGKIIPNWNKHGEIPLVPVVTASDVATDENISSNIGDSSDKRHRTKLETTSIVTLRHMMERNTWIDDPEFARSRKKLYHREIPTDTLSVLNALVELATPSKMLYNLPLVVAIPILEPIVNDDNTNASLKSTRPWKLTISVFAHRLLFECMTTEALGIVMAALDKAWVEKSNFSSIVRPLVTSPAAGPIVFGKDPKTKVDMSETCHIDISDDDDGEGRTRTNDTLDAFSTEGFLKLIENQGVSGMETIYRSKLEPILYGRDNGTDPRNPLLQVSLLPHQSHGVCWMYQMETLDQGENGTSNDNPSLGLNGLLWERRRFHEGDTYYFSPALGQARLTIGERRQDGIKRRARRGGILADEMGLGKTVQAVALILVTLDELKKEKSHFEELEKLNHNDKNEAFDVYESQPDKIYSHATLIIVPPALVGQWTNEIKKIAGGNLLVQFLDHKDQSSRVELNPNADIVLTTYQVLESKGKTTSRKYLNSRNVSNMLSSTIWGRIILDEMQEIRSWNTTISKTCQKLESDRRWMLSGTPLWEGIQDFKGELCFLGLEPFAANNEDGFFDFAIAGPWEERKMYGLDFLRILSLVMLRRTKSMSILENGMPLLGLKNLTLVFEPVPQDPPERAMYCFLESVMHSSLSESNKEHDAEDRKVKQSRVIFLRLLRELCVSSYLMNGGLGCSSQLHVLNRLMKEFNRKELARKSSTHRGENKFYSCDEAILFLSQVEDVARTDSDFVTDTHLGGGRGISRRNRALLINPQEQIDTAREKIKKSDQACKAARSARAKAWWHWALEGVTTGRLRDKTCYEATCPSVARLWNWRNRVGCFESKPALTVLNRGFRPTEKFFGLVGSVQQPSREEKLIELGKRRPEFLWAHPFACLLSNIPIQVTDGQLRESITNIFDSLASSRPHFEIFPPREVSNSKTTERIIQFSHRGAFDRFEKLIKKVDGIQLKTQEQCPFIDQEIEAAKTKYHEAEAMFKVHPCEINERNLTKARVAFKKSKIGLRILDKSNHRAGQVLCERAFGQLRGGSPKMWKDLYNISSREIEEAAVRLVENESIINHQEKTIKAMKRKIELNVAGTGVENLNTIDGLQALKNGEAEKTTCPICVESLGEGEDSDGKVALTRCGHMSCKSCLKRWMDQKEAEGRNISCIECRKPIRFDQLIFVDPKKVDKHHFESRKERAQVLVRQAAKMLEENYGQLEHHLWEALYLVIELPSGIHRNHHSYYTAIPGLFLGHLRNSIGNCLPIDSKATQKSLAPDGKIILPSKFRALLTDLPRDELSVVFASSKSIVLHLQCALEREGFVCKSLFVGQSEKESESAVSDWESPPSDERDEKNATVLIVQAGAAACGLTLTAASKMFIIEPFRKHEEEKQAYARLHRFGQKKAVTCKVYYTPVSVESRLLEWRRRAKSHTQKEEKTVFAPLRHFNDKNKGEDTDCGSEEMIEEDCIESKEKENSNTNDDIVADESQTRFLLGISSSGGEIAVSHGDDGVTEDVEATSNRNTAVLGTAKTPIELSP